MYRNLSMTATVHL